MDKEDRPLRIKKMIHQLMQIQEEHGNLPVRVADDWSELEEDKVEDGFDIKVVQVESVKNPQGTVTIEIAMIRMV